MYQEMTFCQHRFKNNEQKKYLLGMLRMKEKKLNQIFEMDTQIMTYSPSFAPTFIKELERIFLED